MNDESKLALVFELFTTMQQASVNYVYRGHFTHKITESILSLVESRIVSDGEMPVIRKRVYHVMVESLQNITRHQIEPLEIEYFNRGICFIQNKGTKYFITTGNLILNENIESLRWKLEKVNSLEPDELKDLYKKVLITGEMSDKGGAGLGLIDIARKSGNKLQYDFHTIDNIYSYFYMRTEIHSQSAHSEKVTIANETLEVMKNIHENLNKHGILLCFNHSSTQESLISLLTIIEKKMKDHAILKNKFFNIAVELIQNINRHAVAFNEKGKLGLFFIGETESVYYLFSGNYIKNDNLNDLKKRIEFINSLSFEEMDMFFNQRLISFETHEGVENGLGLIDMKLKSGCNLVYDFQRIDDEYSFFSMQVKIPQQ